MDQKTWLWRKKSSEKAIIATENISHTSKENGEVQGLVADKEELEKDLKELNDKLALALSDCDAKDELVKKQTRIAQEANAGWEKAKSEELSMKRDLDEALQQRFVYEERVTHLDGALKECMQQLRFVREEQGKRIQDAVMKASKEFEKDRMAFEEQLSETRKRLAKAEIENSHLNKSIFARESLIGDLKRLLTQAEADHSAMMSRLESTEKDNASLKYELRLLEKELEIRNEEREFNRRTADASHKQHLESAKKIVRLESECQRLRLLVRKRLPGPASLAKMKNEAEMLGRDSVEIRRSKLESSVESSPGTPTRRIETLTEQLYAVEEENKALKESLSKKMNELQFSRVMLSRTASKLLQLESQESPKGQVTTEQRRSNVTSHEFSFASMSDVGSDDKISCAGSSASALISELEHFKSGIKKETLSCRSVGASDINLMDDFVEMEKFAVVSVEKSPEVSRASLKAVNEINGFPKTETNETTPEVVGKEDLNNSIGKIIELIERISLPAMNCDDSDPLCASDGNATSYNNIEMPTGYMVRVFQWKTSELSNVLQRFLHECYDLQNGKSDHEKFAKELTTALDWIMNHCFSLQDVSSMKDAIKKQFDWDETRSESEADFGMIGNFAEADKLHLPKEQLPCFPQVTTFDGLELQCREMYCDEKDESKNIKDKLISAESQIEVLEGRLQSAADRIESLTDQLRESEKTIDSLRLELQSLKQSNGILEDQIKNHKLINSDLDAQDTEAKLNMAHRKVLALQEELENKERCCEELEARCLELQLQLESVLSVSKECSNHGINQKDKSVRNDLEITAASEKLAECQETILNLGKQLKALAAPKDGSLLDNVSSQRNTIISTASTTTNMDQSLAPPEVMKAKNRSLLDQMLSEDGTKAKVSKPTSNCNSNLTSIEGIIEPLEKILALNEIKDGNVSTTVNSLPVVPAKKPRSGSLWKKLLWKKKKTANMKTTSPLNT